MYVAYAKNMSLFIYLFTTDLNFSSYMRRVSVMCYVLMMVVLTNAFSGMVSAFLISNPFEQIKTFQQLLATDSHIITPDGYVSHLELKQSNDSLMQKVFSRI